MLELILNQIVAYLKLVIIINYYNYFFSFISMIDLLVYMFMKRSLFHFLFFCLMRNPQDIISDLSESTREVKRH